MRRPAGYSSSSKSDTSVPPASSTSTRTSYPTHDVADPSNIASQLLNDPTKAEKLLGWKRKVDLDSLVEEMVPTNLQASRNRGPIENRNRVLSVAYGGA